MAFFKTEEVRLARKPNTSIIAVVAVAATVALVFIALAAAVAAVDALADVAVVVDDVFIVTQLAFFTQKMQLTFFSSHRRSNF